MCPDVPAILDLANDATRSLVTNNQNMGAMTSKDISWIMMVKMAVQLFPHIIIDRFNGYAA